MIGLCFLSLTNYKNKCDLNEDYKDGILSNGWVVTFGESAK